jgi:hypothetical protein
MIMSLSHASLAAFVHGNVTPGIFSVDIISREPSEANIIHALHPSIDYSRSLSVSEWKSFHIPVCFSFMDLFEVNIMATTNKNVDASSEITVLFKMTDSPQQLTLSFDKHKLMTFDIEYTWKPLTINTTGCTSTRLPQVIYVTNTLTVSNSRYKDVPNS